MNRYLNKLLSFIGPSRSRKESNKWIELYAADIEGLVLSIGSAGDDDKEGRKYKNYFKKCTQYITSEFSDKCNTDMVLDIRNMSEVNDKTVDCVFCSGVLEHVDDVGKAVSEISRILKDEGMLLLGVPFRQAIHMPPHDYWRFTEFGIKVLLDNYFEILNIDPMDARIYRFPVAYWVRAKKK